MKNIRTLLLISALALPLTASTCTETKDVELVLGVPAEFPAQFTSDGSINHHDDVGVIDLREELDLANELDDADIDPGDVEEVQVVQVFYRITQPQAGRSIENGELQITRGSGTEGSFVPAVGPVVVASGYTADASAVTPWIDITADLQSGINVLNALAADLLAEVQGGPAATNTAVEYHVIGDSVPAGEATDLKWEIKVVIQVVANREFDVPFS